MSCKGWGAAYFLSFGAGAAWQKNTGAGAGKKISALKPWYILYNMRTPLLPDIPWDFFAEFSAAEAALSKHSLIPCSWKMHLIIQNIFSRKSIVFIDVSNLISNINGNMVKKRLGFTACSKIRFCMDVMIILQDN